MNAYMMPAVPESGSDSYDVEMGLFANATHYMGVIFGVFIIIFGVIGLVVGTFGIPKALKHNTSLAQPIVQAIIGVIAIIAGGKLLPHTLNSSPEDSADQPTETPTPEPSPSPDPSPAPAPESHNAPNITVDSTAAIIIAVTVAVVLLIIALVLLYKKQVKRRAAQQKERDLRAMVRRDFDYADKHIKRISAQYTQAHVDPNYVLYKPLVISDDPLAYEFNTQLMSARATLEECAEALRRDTKADIDFVTKSKLRKLANSLDRAWDNLNRKAEEVGTPLLDAGQLRRAESLWSLATNESATVHERQRAMDKLQKIIAECQADLANHTQNKITVTKKARDKAAEDTEKIARTKKLLGAIAAVVDNGVQRGVIAPPHRFTELMPSAIPALTA